MKHYIGAGNPMHAQFEPKSAYRCLLYTSDAADE